MKRELTVKDILSMLLAHIKLIVILSVVAGLVAFCYAKFFITPLYSASALVYVSNSDTVVSLGDNTQPTAQEGTETGNKKVSSGDFTTSEKIAATCTVLFKTDVMMDLIKKDIGDIYSSGQLKSMIKITSVNETQALRVTITGAKPEDTAKIANSFANNSNKVYRDFIPAGGVRVIEEATVPSAPSSPDIKKNTLYGLAAGLILAVLIALFIEIIDTTVKSEDDLYKMYEIPVFAEIVDYEGEGKG